MLCFLLVFLPLGDTQGAHLIDAQHDFGFEFTSDSSNIDPTDKYNHVCVFCHTPNVTKNKDISSWNRNNISKTFAVYGSSFGDKTSQNIQGSVSMACLGCHDGTLAKDRFTNIDISQSHHKQILYPIGEASNNSSDTTATSVPCAFCQSLAEYLKSEEGHSGAGSHSRYSYDVHPVSVMYPNPSKGLEFHIPPDIQRGWQNMKLFDGKVECASCHDIHSSTKPPFLRISNRGSRLCKICHDK
jgi:predicted CXXCH cytochrome family protein